MNDLTIDRLREGPFGPARPVVSLPVEDVIAKYREKCGADVARWFGGNREIHLYECAATGYRFWRPESIAGDEAFYRHLSALWRDYYRTDRWEYALVRPLLPAGARVLEVGCGRGYFLRSIEGQARDALGLELNKRAIADKVTRFEVVAQPVDVIARAQAGGFDAVVSFQVLEHVIDPRGFLDACVACLRPGGLLAVATPNHDSAVLAHRDDAFDLPPHHMGHFTAQAYRQIAPLIGMRLERIEVERRYFELTDRVTERLRRRFHYRAARRLASLAMDFAYRAGGEPGNNILAVMRKP